MRHLILKNFLWLSFLMMVFLIGCNDKSTNSDNFSKLKKISFKFENLHGVYEDYSYGYDYPFYNWSHDTTYEVFNYLSEYTNKNGCVNSLISSNEYSLYEYPPGIQIYFQVDEINKKLTKCRLNISNSYESSNYHKREIIFNDLPIEKLTESLISINLEGKSISNYITLYSDKNTRNYIEVKRSSGYRKEIKTLLPCTDSTRLTITISE